GDRRPGEPTGRWSDPSGRGLRVCDASGIELRSTRTLELAPGPAHCFGRLSADAVEQLRWGGQLEASREDHDRLEPRRALTPLEQADLCAVQIAHVCQCLLGESDPRAMAAQVGGELLADKLHAPHCGWPQTEGLQTGVRTWF